MQRFLAAFFCFASTVMQAQIAAPRIGCIVDRTGSLRPLLGIGGSFVLDEPQASDAIAFFCGDRYATVKTHSKLLLLDLDGRTVAEWGAAPGPVLIAATPSGLPRVVHYPQTSEWYAIRGPHFKPLSLDTSTLVDEVLGIVDLGHDRIRFVGRRNGEVLSGVISVRTGETWFERQLGSISGPFFLESSGAKLFASERGFSLERAHSEVWRFDLPAAPAWFASIGKDRVQVHLQDGSDWALFLTPGREAVYELPGGTQ